MLRSTGRNSWSAAGRLGSFGVTYSLEDERAPLGSLRYDAVLTLAFGGLVTIFAVYTFLLRALAPLGRLARFSAEIPRRLATLASTRDSMAARAASDELASMLRRA